MSLQSPEHVPFDNYTRRGSPVLWVIAIVCAGLLTCALFAGYVLMRNRYAPVPQSSERQANTAAAPQRIRAQVFADEPFLRNSQAVIGGIVRNVSDETLENLTVVLVLTRSDATGAEARHIALMPSRLAPNEEGRYALMLPAREWRDVRVSGLRNGDAGEEIGFNTAIGARRPLESAPRPRRSTQQRSRPDNDGFFNTPDTPVVIR